LLTTHEDKLYASQQLTALLDEADKPQQPENQIQYIWNTLVAWFSACYYGTTPEDYDTTCEAITTLKTVSQNITSALQPGFNTFNQRLNPEQPYAFTDTKIKALGEGSLGRNLQIFINNGSADILANTRVETIPELIQALQANHPSPGQTEHQKAKHALSHLFTQYFKERIGSGPKQKPSQYYWGGLFKCLSNAKSLDEKIVAIQKLCRKIDNIKIEPGKSWSRQFTANLILNPSGPHYFGYHSQSSGLNDTDSTQPFTPEEFETLNNGNLGKALRAFINDKHASALLGQEINSLAEFVTTVNDVSAPKKQGDYSY
jgi:hypothetical protein